MLKINKLHKSYKMGDSSLHVLKGIDLNIEKGEMVAIMGSSGSGKCARSSRKTPVNRHAALHQRPA